METMNSILGTRESSSMYVGNKGGCTPID